MRGAEYDIARDELTELFAQALDGDPVAEHELGCRAFAHSPASSNSPAGVPADPRALRAYIALHQPDYEHLLRDLYRRRSSPAQRATDDQRSARSRSALLTRLRDHGWGI